MSDSRELQLSTDTKITKNIHIRIDIDNKYPGHSKSNHHEVFYAIPFFLKVQIFCKKTPMSHSELTVSAEQNLATISRVTDKKSRFDTESAKFSTPKSEFRYKIVPQKTGKIRILFNVIEDKQKFLFTDFLAGLSIQHQIKYVPFLTGTLTHFTIQNFLPFPIHNLNIEMIEMHDSVACDQASGSCDTLLPNSSFLHFIVIENQSNGATIPPECGTLKIEWEIEGFDEIFSIKQTMTGFPQIERRPFACSITSFPTHAKILEPFSVKFEMYKYSEDNQLPEYNDFTLTILTDQEDTLLPYGQTTFEIVGRPLAGKSTVTIGCELIAVRPGLQKLPTVEIKGVGFATYNVDFQDGVYVLAD